MLRHHSQAFIKFYDFTNPHWISVAGLLDHADRSSQGGLINTKKIHENGPELSSFLFRHMVDDRHGSSPDAESIPRGHDPRSPSEVFAQISDHEKRERSWLRIWISKTVERKFHFSDLRQRRWQGLEFTGGEPSSLEEWVSAARTRDFAVPMFIHGNRFYWFFHSDWYSESERLSSEDVTALIGAREIKMRRRTERAKSMVAAEQTENTPRQAIPRTVKEAVWRRDQGRCVECGSRELLEFDHVIPLAMGGSNTERNLQLLCSTCNREKGDSL
jgi:hypothetical protein